MDSHGPDDYRHRPDMEEDMESKEAFKVLTKQLRQALEDGIHDLDGFYTFCIGTRDGFAVLRDPIACKHAVLAETDDWVAMATEYRAIATLPGSAEAAIWEPKPQTIYTWGGAASDQSAGMQAELVAH